MARAKTKAQDAIAIFISPHGLGHAARAAAVMEAIRVRQPGVRLELFTTAPEWFFQSSLKGPFRYHKEACDVGLVQKNAMEEDLSETIKILDGFLPFSEARVKRLAAAVRRAGCRLVICDIAPLGIAVAKAAGVPSILIENFTWDWIYAAYRDPGGHMGRHIAYLRSWFRQATYRVQTEPVSVPAPDAALVTPPVGRRPRLSRAAMRVRLGLEAGRKAVLLTMGGVAHPLGFMNRLARRTDICFLLPGNRQDLHVEGAIHHIPQHLDFYHPDLVHASDAVVGKAGYSTLAEVYHAGVPFGYVLRERFPEAAKLGAFIDREMSGIQIAPADFESGIWIRRLDKILSLPRAVRTRVNGADRIAKWVEGLA